MKYDFSNKVVWITGASSGIGEQMALAFAKHSSRLVLSARSKDALEKVADKCRQAGSPEVLLMPLDLMVTDTMPGIADEVVSRMGTIDLLVNNGGVSQRSLVKETPMSVYRQLMDVNYFGTIALTKAVLPTMIANKSGFIVVTSSIVGKIGSPLRSGYAASKHALHGFFDSLRAEVFDDNIKVLIVCGGFIKTNISMHALNEDGSPTGKMDKNQMNGMAPIDFVHKVLSAIRSGRQEIYVGGVEVLSIYIKRLFPSLINGIVRKKY